jgi:multidrug transporter EmrE-like cation transporter
MAWLGVAIAVLVLSALLFGESVTPAKVVGVTLVLGGLTVCTCL